MNITQALTLTVLTIFGAGCASAPSAAANPESQPRPTIRTSVPTGTLLVFSEWDRLSNSSDSIWIRHTDYSIFDADGKLVRQIKNHNLGPDSRPVAVELPPGNYVIKARKQGSGWVSVPVSLKVGDTSEIYLDDSSRPVATQNHSVQVIK